MTQRVISIILLSVGILLLAAAGFIDWEGSSGVAALTLGTLGGCLLTALGGLLLGKSFFS
ncbi:MAG: hypothetical protein Q7Q71_05365 [Verrucomicrobiota bacterium JB023]|nr:hypothetical protein [Verrucomicrobiota bacterium JB023]